MVAQTSIQAYTELSERGRKLDNVFHAIYRAYQRGDSITALSIQAETGLPNQTVCPRIVELRNQGYVYLGTRYFVAVSGTTKQAKRSRQTYTLTEINPIYTSEDIANIEQQIRKLFAKRRAIKSAIDRSVKNLFDDAQ